MSFRPSAICLAPLAFAACTSAEVLRPVNPGEVTTLASGLHAPQHIAVDAFAVYATVGGPERGCADDCPSPDGAIVAARFTADASTLWFAGQAVTGVSSDGANVYASTSEGRIVSVPAAGGNATTLVTGRSQPKLIRSRADGVYWVDCGTCGFVFEPNAEILKTSGAAETPAADSIAAPGGFVGGMELDGNELIVTRSNRDRVTGTTDTAVLAIDVASGAERVITTELVTAQWVVADDASVYFVDGNDIVKVAKSGGAVTTIVSASTPRALAVDATHVYFTDGGIDSVHGRVARVQKDGSGLETLAADQIRPAGIVAEGDYVYWANSGSYSANDGSIMALRKPM